MRLNRSKLLIKKAYIDGDWVEDQEGKVFDVVNPSNGDVLAKVPDLGRKETEDAIKAAQLAFQTWKNTSASERAQLLKEWHRLMIENADDLGTILSMEQGKPLPEAIGEIKYGASFVEWFAEEARRNYGDTIPGHTRDTRIITIRQAVGVVGAITPWNFPNAMITRKLAPALAAGCAVVLKPAALTPLSALAIAKLAEEAGIPHGVINVITSKQSAEVGRALTDSNLVRKISFTGSTEVGKKLLAQCAGTVKKVSMELGGNAPFIVLNDADIDAAVEGAIASKFRNAGQTCVCANRIYAQKEVYEEFTSKLTKAVKALKVGDGLEEGVTIGPLIDGKALEKVESLVNDAVSKGGKVELGGKRSQLGGTFYAPTVISDATTEMDLTKEEIFGPIAPVYRFESDKEVIELANNTNVGLASYFYGSNVNRIFKIAEALEYGMVGINTGMISTTVAPFGGVKESGMGREGSKYGLEDYTEIKYMCFGGIK